MATNLRRRFARGIAKTVRGAGGKFKGMTSKAMQKARQTYQITSQANKGGGLNPRGAGFLTDPTNAIAGASLAGAGVGMSRQARQEKLLRQQGVAFSGGEYEDLIEFAMEPGIDPALVKNLLEQAARIQQEGQTKIIISRQLFEQLQAALENFQVQKQQVDNASVQRIQTRGFNAGFDLIELNTK